MSFMHDDQTENWRLDVTVRQIDTRIDFARMDLYRLLMLGRHDEEFLVEDIFNRFLSIVQAPMNFAVFDKNNKLMFHLVNDLRYQEFMNEKLLDFASYKEDLLPFFPQLFGRDTYKVLIFRMNTKVIEKADWIQPVSVNQANQRELKWDKKIGQAGEYEQRCAWRYFTDEWSGFRTELFNKARKALEHSMQSFASNYLFSSSQNKGALWPYTQVAAEKMLCNADETSHSDLWHEDVRRLFEQILAEAASGLEAQHFLMREGQHQSRNRELLPNMFVAYRSFGRTTLRKGWGADVPGYPYDTQILIKNRKGGNNLPVVKYFRRLAKLVGRTNGTSEFLKGRDFLGAVGDERVQDRNERVLYAEIFDHMDEAILENRYPENSDLVKRELQKIVSHVDAEFWSLLVSEDGPSKCIDILQSPVGDNARSFVDPVYHTGLIHFSSLFEMAGVNRVGSELRIVNDTVFLGGEIFDCEEFVANNRDDLLRIVMLFYLFSEMVDWGVSNEAFDPSRLEAVLVPIKVEGSVWAVTCHAVYKPKKINGGKDSFSRQYVPYWMSVYHLCSTIKQKNDDLFEAALLKFTLDKVSEELETSFFKLSEVTEYRQAIEQFNKQMDIYRRYIPYALPKIYTARQTSGGNEVMQLRLSGARNKTYLAEWGTPRNDYFVPAQKWFDRPQKWFESSLKEGLTNGMYGIVRKRMQNDAS